MWPLYAEKFMRQAVVFEVIFFDRRNTEYRNTESCAGILVVSGASIKKCTCQCMTL